MSSESAARDYELTCWYLNLRRVAELVKAGSMAARLRALSSIGDANGLQRTAVLAFFEQQLTSWLRTANPPTLGQLILTNQLGSNAIFTHYSNYFFKGLSKVNEAIRKSKPVPMAEAYAKLDDLSPGLRTSFHFHHEHLTSSSSWTELTGQRRVLVLGITKQATETEIETVPIMIAYPYVHILSNTPSLIGSHWMSRLELFVDSIDSFARITEFEPSRNKKDLEALKTVSEAKVKAAFAEIIGEPTVPLDWGGERSDLFSTRVKIQGERVSAAFALKGPARFHPMTVADLGKNGDQIDRLFSEPADLIILQHCHEITPPVRGMMRAYAQRMGQLRAFCMIDGYDTLRILGAYGKYGINPGRKRANH